MGEAVSIVTASGGSYRVVEFPMGNLLYWAVVLLIIAIVAGFFGFGGVAGTASGFASILFYIFIILFVIALVMGVLRRGRI